MVLMRMRECGGRLAGILLAFACLAGAKVASGQTTIVQPMREVRSAPVRTQAVPSVPLTAKRDTAGVGAATTLALTSVAIGVGPDPTHAQRPQSAADLARVLYADRARLETATAISPTLNLVWLTGGVAVRSELPFRVFGLNPRTRELMALVPIFDDRGGLRYRSSEHAYVGEMLIGFRDSLKPNGAFALERPLRIVVGGTVESVQPTILEISRINEIAATVRLVSARRPEGAVLKLHPDFSPIALEIPIPLFIDSLIVTAPEAMRGLGTEEREIVISLPAGSIAPGDSLEVTVATAKGEISPSGRIYLKPDASAAVRLRSRGLGSAVLRIESGVMAASPTVIQYTTPWLLLGLAGVGALVGAWLRHRTTRGQSPRPSFPWENAVISVVVVAAFSAGLDLIGPTYWVVLSEVGTFALAALVAGGKALVNWKDRTAPSDAKPA